MEDLARIVPKLQVAWPKMKLTVWGDGGFVAPPSSLVRGE